MDRFGSYFLFAPVELSPGRCFFPGTLLISIVTCKLPPPIGYETGRLQMKIKMPD